MHYQKNVFGDDLTIRQNLWGSHFLNRNDIYEYWWPHLHGGYSIKSPQTRQAGIQMAAGVCRGIQFDFPTAGSYWDDIFRHFAERSNVLDLVGASQEILLPLYESLMRSRKHTSHLSSEDMLMKTKMFFIMLRNTHFLAGALCSLNWEKWVQYIRDSDF